MPSTHTGSHEQLARAYQPASGSAVKGAGRRHFARRKWLKSDDALLTQLWQTRSLNECAALLERSTSSVYNRVHKLGLKRTDEYRAITGSGQFGSRPPWNLGLKGFQAGGKSKATQFKLGHKPSNTWRPVGAERTDRDGTLWRKIDDTGDKKADWRPVSNLIWKERNGPLPTGKFVVFIDRNKENFDPANLMAVTRAENMQRNSIDRYPTEYRRAALTLGWFQRKLRKLENEDTD